MDRAPGWADQEMTGLVAAVLLGFLGLVLPTHAAEFACTAGDVPCLITAIHTADGNGGPNTITLAAGVYTLTAVDHDTDGPTGLPSITGALILRGPGAQSIAIVRAAAAGRFRILHVAATGVLTLEGLTLWGGDLIGLPDGGGGLRNRGIVTIAHSILYGNAASNGGGIFSTGPLVITDSTVSGNVAGDGGGIFFDSGNGAITNSTLSSNIASGNGGGIAIRAGSLTIRTSTLYGNTAGSEGGGIALEEHYSTATLINCTVSGNIASVGGGVGTIAAPGAVSLQNTILAGNWVPPTGTGPDCSAIGTSKGHNLFGESTGCPTTATDLTGDPDLGAFTDNGTPGQGYVPLHPTSPAIQPPAPPPTSWGSRGWAPATSERLSSSPKR